MTVFDIDDKILLELKTNKEKEDYILKQM